MTSNPASTTVQNVRTTLTNCADLSDAYNELNGKIVSLNTLFEGFGDLFKNEEDKINEYVLKNKTLNNDINTILNGNYGTSQKNIKTLKDNLAEKLLIIKNNNELLNTITTGLNEKINNHKKAVIAILTQPQPPLQSGGSKKSRKPRTKNPVTTKKSVKK